ncbi:MAG: Rap1a/Tai family immunity protein [Alphaproteobacteria bacterium]
MSKQSINGLPRNIMLLAMTVIVLFPLPSKAAQFSGAYLIHVCGSDAKGKEIAPGGHIACQAYIAGILDYHNLLRTLGTAPSVDFCVPKNTELKKLQTQVFSYVFKHRQQHGSFTAAPAVALGLHNAYPCK